MRHDSSRAVDQECSQVRISALADTQQPHPTTGAALPRHQPKPGGELAARLEHRGITHRGDRGRGTEQANARDFCQAPAGLTLAMPVLESLLDLQHLLIELTNARVLLAQRIDERGR
jgi:hypothetical protein